MPPSRKKHVGTCQSAHTIVVADSAPNRVARAVELLTPRHGKPSLRYVDAVFVLSSEFPDVSERTLHRDMAKAYTIIRERLEAMDVGTVVRTELEHIARTAEMAKDYATASATWGRLAKLAGLEQPETSLAAKLTDAALEHAIKAAVTERVKAMQPDELEALLAEKQGAA